MLHANEQQRKVRAEEVSLGRRVRSDGLVVLAFVGKRVGVGDPGGAETRIDQNRFPVDRLSAQKQRNAFDCPAHPKYRLDSSQRLPAKYHSPTAYQLIASSGSFSTISCASRNSLERMLGRWCMLDRWIGSVGRWEG